MLLELISRGNLDFNLQISVYKSLVVEQKPLACTNGSRRVLLSAKKDIANSVPWDHYLLGRFLATGRYRTSRTPGTATGFFSDTYTAVDEAVASSSHGLEADAA